MKSRVKRNGKVGRACYAMKSEKENIRLVSYREKC